MSVTFTDYAKHVAELNQRMNAIKNNPKKQKKFEELVSRRKSPALRTRASSSKRAKK